MTQEADLSLQVQLFLKHSEELASQLTSLLTINPSLVEMKVLHSWSSVSALLLGPGSSSSSHA